MKEHRAGTRDVAKKVQMQLRRCAPEQARTSLGVRYPQGDIDKADEMAPVQEIGLLASKNMQGRAAPGRNE